jgi:hypothetical protein
MRKIILHAVFVLVAINLYAQTWHQVIVPSSEQLNDIHFTSNSVGYIAGNNNTILKTINGGLTWSILSPTGLNPDFDNVDIDFENDLHGYLIQNETPFSSRMYKTLDGGLTWPEFNETQGNHCNLLALEIAGPEHLFYGGSGCFQGPILGEYFQGSFSNKTVANNSLFDPSVYINDIELGSTFSLMTSNSNYIFRSTDGGQVWDSIAVDPSTSVILSEVLIMNDSLSFVSNAGPGGFSLYHSLDEGISWTPFFTGFNYPYLNCVDSDDNGNIYTGGYPSSQQGGLIMSCANLNSWSLEYVSQPVRDFANLKEDIQFAVGDSGMIWVNKPLAQLGLESNPHLTNKGLNIYPNPSSGLVRLENFEGIEQIEIIDLQGKILMMRELSKSQELNLEELNSGLYLLYYSGEGIKGTTRLIIQ